MNTKIGIIPLFCRVCAHTEWLPADQELPRTYQCPMCGAHPISMLKAEHAFIQKQELGVETITDGLWCLRRKPRFNREWEHLSYVIRMRDGLMLFDSPPIYNDNAIATISDLGQPKTLLISHQDFVGPAQLWRKRFELDVLMGDETPLPGNVLSVDKRVVVDTPLDEAWTIRPMSGHTIGSVIMTGTLSNGEAVLLAGDSLAIFDHSDGRLQISIFEEKGHGISKLRKQLETQYHHLCTCTGWLSEPQNALAALLSVERPCARPDKGDKGGIWGDRIEDRWITIAD